MSEEITISNQLVEDVRQAFFKHDSRVDDDHVFSQYLAASIGILLGEHQATLQQKNQFLEQLFQFSAHVVSQQSEEHPAEDSLGHWKPGDS